MITPEETLATQIMLTQLTHEALDVVLMPAPDPKHQGHHIRAVEGCNPLWYQQLCKEYPKNRTIPRERHEKFTDSLIDRSSVKKALVDISSGRNSTTYTGRLLPYVRQYAQTFGGQEC